jgi:hypothetical protein
MSSRDHRSWTVLAALGATLWPILAQSPGGEQAPARTGPRGVRAMPRSTGHNEDPSEHRSGLLPHQRIAHIPSRSSLCNGTLLIRVMRKGWCCRVDFFASEHAQPLVVFQICTLVGICAILASPCVRRSDGPHTSPTRHGTVTLMDASRRGAIAYACTITHHRVAVRRRVAYAPA